MSGKSAPTPWRLRSLKGAAILATTIHFDANNDFYEVNVLVAQLPATERQADDADLIVTAVNAWSSPAALRERIEELEKGD